MRTADSDSKTIDSARKQLLPGVDLTGVSKTNPYMQFLYFLMIQFAEFNLLE